MSLETQPFAEPITEPDILASIQALPTEDDLPYDDGVPMETALHRDQMWTLIYSLQTYWSDRPNNYIGGNMFLYYDPQNLRKFRGPDFFVVLDVEDRERKSWVVWHEGMRFPDVIIELLSDSTRETDKGEKKTLYERVFHTSEYYLYDPISQEFVSYHLRGGRYETIQPDEQGKVYSPSTGLYLAVRNEWLRWLTPEGLVVPTPGELAEQERLRADQEQLRADQEQLRADQEQLRADQEHKRVVEERQRAEQERLRADQEHKRVVEERQRAEQEHQRAEQAEELLEKYRQRFGKLEG
jgi:Uma2 family endonuclease